jgi:hypothetical protein
MIDNPGQAMRLLSRLDAALPILAGLSQELAAVVKERSRMLETPERVRITRVDYAGDEGGIMCSLDFGSQSRFVVSITHLKFDPRHELAREIAAYKKRRVKRINKRALLGMEPEEAIAALQSFGWTGKAARAAILGAAPKSAS